MTDKDLEKHLLSIVGKIRGDFYEDMKYKNPIATAINIINKQQARIKELEEEKATAKSKSGVYWVDTEGLDQLLKRNFELEKQREWQPINRVTVGKDIIVKTSDNVCTVTPTIDDCGFLIFISCGSNSTVVYNPTHWMPIPQLPRTKEDA